MDPCGKGFSGMVSSECCCPALSSEPGLILLTIQVVLCPTWLRHTASAPVGGAVGLAASAHCSLLGLRLYFSDSPGGILKNLQESPRNDLAM